MSAALALELDAPATESFPHAATDIDVGSEISPDLVVFRSIPGGFLDAPDLDGARARVEIGAGEPIVAALVGPALAIPADWWALPIALPEPAVPGTEVLVVLLDPPSTTPGVVVHAGSGDVYSINDAGLVAVPPESAEAVARAAAAGLVTILVAP